MDDRKHLTSREIEKLIAATKEARHEARDCYPYSSYVSARLARFEMLWR